MTMAKYPRQFKEKRHEQRDTKQRRRRGERVTGAPLWLLWVVRGAVLLGALAIVGQRMGWW